jgi:uncharacterized protein (TIGR02145 family)
LFTANQKGTTVVRATSLDAKKSVDATINIWQNYVTDVIIKNPDPLRLTIGAPAVALIAEILPENATRKTLDWKSANSDIAVVSGASVTGVTIGSTAITASTTDNSGKNVSINCIVYPRINDLLPVTVNLGAIPQQLSLPVTTPIVPDGTYTWGGFTVSSNNPGVATVNSSGLLSFTGAGAATITVQFINYPESAKTFAVTVRDCTGAPTATIGSLTQTINKNAPFSVTANVTTTGATTYSWSLPEGLNGSSSTNSIIVTGSTTDSYDGSAIQCTVENACDLVIASGSGTITVRNCSATATLSPMILSATSVNKGATFTASVPEVTGENAPTSYTWILPSGLTGSSTTRTITITASTTGTYVAGAIKVTATNDCGISAEQSNPSDVKVNDLGSPGETITGSRGTYTTYCYPDGIGCWMTQSSKEGSYYATTYTGKTAGERGYYYTAVQYAGACPTGYVLPTDAQWRALSSYIRGSVATTAEKNHWLTTSSRAGVRETKQALWLLWDTAVYFAVENSRYLLDTTWQIWEGEMYDHSTNFSDSAVSVRCIKK